MRDMNDFVFDHTAFHQALDGHAIVSVTDVRGDILYVNDLFCQISGFSREALLGQNHRVIKSDEHGPEVFQQVWRTIASGKTWHGEIKNTKRDGGFYWVKTSIMPVLNDVGKPYQYISIRTEVTDRKLVEEKLKAALQIKSEFLSRMNHEIRTPLNGIIGLSEVLAETDLDVEQSELLKEIQVSSESLMRLLINLLDFEEVSTGRKAFDVMWVNVAEFAVKVTRNWREQAQTLGIYFDCQLAENLPKHLIFDPVKTQRIIDELLDNAFKFTVAGKVILRVYLQQEQTVVIEVEDTGTGISADAIERIFKPFGPLDSSIVREKDGAGIGLALCNEMAKRIGGKMSVETELGKGTVFRIILPILSDMPIPIAALERLANG